MRKVNKSQMLKFFLLMFVSILTACGGGENPDRFNIDPVAAFTVTPLKGSESLTVVFDASASFDKDGTIVSYNWDYGDDAAIVTLFTPVISTTYAAAGTYNVKLTITDNTGFTETITKRVTVTLPVDVAVSGTATYTSFKLTAEGIDYANPLTKPIRGAVIELQDSSGTVLESSKTTVTGGYSFTVSPNTDIQIVVKADIGNTTVIDNTDSNKLYSKSSDVFNFGSEDQTKDLNADSGWGSDGTRIGDREAAPFNILDLIFLAQRKIREFDSNPDTVYAEKPLKVNWSTSNGGHAPLIDAAGNEDLSNGGLEGNSSYDGQLNLWILGKADEDTDEYDPHTILHEWFHYFESELGNSDSTGGAHSPEDILDPSLAFGEGFAYAFAAMILDDPLYIETSGVGQKVVDFTNYELDSVDDDKKSVEDLVKIDGFYSEASVQEVIWDLYDGRDFDSNNDSDNDGLALGLLPIYSVIVNGQKTTQSFTSIVSFLHHLKLEVPLSADQINTIAQAENINMANADEFEILDFMGDGLPTLYRTFEPDFPIFFDNGALKLSTFDVFGEITPNDSGNKLLNERFFKTTIFNAGCYTLSVTPSEENALMDFRFPGAFSLDESEVVISPDVKGGTKTFSFPLSSGVFAFSVVAKNDGNTGFSLLISSSFDACP